MTQGYRSTALRHLALMMLAALVLLVTLPDRAAAQIASLQAYGSDTGLQDMGVRCLVEDQGDTLWACTSTGLYRYDGLRFERIGRDAGLNASLTNHFVPGRGGGAWIATASELFYWNGNRAAPVRDPRGRSFPDATVAVAGKAAIIVSGGRAWRTRLSDSRWAATPLFAGGDLVALPALAKLQSVHAERGRLWFGCGKAICAVDPAGHVRTYDVGDGVAADDWLLFLRDRRGTLWARSARHVAAMPAGALRFAEVPPPTGSGFTIPTRLLSLIEDHAGRILTRSDSGVVRWEDGRWTMLGGTSALPDQAPDAMMLSRKGDLWLSYAGTGVVRWRGYDTIENWGRQSGLKGTPTWSMIRGADGRMRFGNERGLYRMDGHLFREERLPLPEPARNVASMVRDRGGNLWAALYDGHLLEIGPSGRVMRRIAVPYGLRRIALDRAGHLWLCTDDGIWTIRDLERPGVERLSAVPSASFGDVAEDRQGRLWFAGKGGLFRHDPAGATVPIGVTGPLPNRQFDKIAVAPDGELWVGIDDVGLFHGRPGGDRLALRPVDDALLREVIPYFIRFDRRGRLWVGSNAGLDVARGGRWVRITAEDGLLGEDMSESAFYEDADGSIWVGYSNGVGRIVDPDRLLSPPPPHLVIRNVTRAGRPIAPDARLPWALLPVRITLATPGSTAGQGAVMFRYRLRGQQDDWIETPSRTLDFPALGSGTQVIEIQAVDRAKRLRSPVVTFTFRILPPWWRSAPAILLWAAIGVVLVSLLWTARVRKVRWRERELEAIVAARTRELSIEKAALQEASDALLLQATHDSLTGLRNRGSIIACLSESVARAAQGGQPLAVALIDLDHFKQVNDRFGHLAGDAVLCAVAERLSRNMRASDVVGRYGGEEMLVVMPGLPTPGQERLAALLAAIGREPIEADGTVLTVTGSIGVAWLVAGETETDILKRADAALYAAKRQGRNRVVVAEG